MPSRTTRTAILPRTLPAHSARTPGAARDLAHEMRHAGAEIDASAWAGTTASREYLDLLNRVHECERHEPRPPPAPPASYGTALACVGAVAAGVGYSGVVPGAAGALARMAGAVWRRRRSLGAVAGVVVAGGLLYTVLSRHTPAPANDGKWRAGDDVAAECDGCDEEGGEGGQTHAAGEPCYEECCGWPGSGARRRRPPALMSSEAEEAAAARTQEGTRRKLLVPREQPRRRRCPCALGGERCENEAREEYGGVCAGCANAGGCTCDCEACIHILDDGGADEGGSDCAADELQSEDDWSENGGEDDSVDEWEREYETDGGGESHEGGGGADGSLGAAAGGETSALQRSSVCSQRRAKATCASSRR